MPNSSNWTKDALCAQVGPGPWFPERGQNYSAAGIEICARCPVRQECLTEGLGQPHGVWGGLTHEERKAHPDWVGGRDISDELDAQILEARKARQEVLG